MNVPAHNALFAFEQDFAGTLRCIPMCVRLKLDLVRIKVSLRQWSQIGADQRRVLLDLPCTTPEQQHVYRDTLVALIERHCDEPVKELVKNDDALWQDAGAVPECVIAQATSDHVDPPSCDSWQALNPLRRFALVKLARSKHENENFVPAMREFGLLSTEM
ncbi:nitrate reductase associated protein [Asaia lannensis]|uniref:nitrate reductase associated protein n=1 Tax=Asaia lannensis TaxID=415421 RepID=UPI001C9953AF